MQTQELNLIFTVNACVHACQGHPRLAGTSRAPTSMLYVHPEGSQVLPLDSALKGQQLNKATALMESLLAFGFDFSLTSDQTGKQEHGRVGGEKKKKKNNYRLLATVPEVPQPAD